MGVSRALINAHIGGTGVAQLFTEAAFNSFIKLHRRYSFVTKTIMFIAIYIKHGGKWPEIKLTFLLECSPVFDLLFSIVHIDQDCYVYNNSYIVWVNYRKS